MSVGSESVAGQPTVAIDGPSGSGKSTVARALARQHGWRYVDTGAMYRALTWWALQRDVALDDSVTLAQLADELPLQLGIDPDDPVVRVGDVDVTAAIRSSEVTNSVSAVSAHPAVRESLVDRQRQLAAGGGVVMEGRDITTVVLPDADVKVFLTADAHQRATRRERELGADSEAGVAAAIDRRDSLDSSRAVSPLRQAADALVIDSTDMDVAAVVAAIERALSPSAPTRRSPANPARSRRSTEGPILWVVRRVARLVVRLVFRVRVFGEGNIPTDGPVLLAGNHTGFLDGPLVYILLRDPAMFLAKSELFSGGFARILRAVRQVPIHRGAPDRFALQAALSELSAGGIVAMFPEGTRGEGKLETIQDGVGYLAGKAGCPVVPIVCRGTREALPKGSALPRWRASIDILVGEPFIVSSPALLRRSDIAQAANAVGERLRRAVADAGA